ncbi:MAG: lysophospholipid acyltransferase family protein [Muribaculaceae bacterium]|nr:lysophospholipid acyltransferase family protein [Muribaculaceae bacterium]MDE7109609.1 lysophospholipid acyltransferase family protein [Muribaculaceae bacterium]
MNKTNTTIGGRALSLIFSIIGSLPLWILYGIADIVAFLVGYVVGYRRGVIRDNLNRCFPEMTDKQRRKIERKFYHFLGDYFVETLRLGRMSEKEIRKRMKFENMEEVNEWLAQGKSISVYLGHYCNWEWVSSMPLHVINGAIGGQIYHPLESKSANYAFLKIREHFGAYSIDMDHVMRVLMNWHREKIPAMIGYIADQTPNFHAIHYFADFFGQETATFTGPERLAKTFSTPVFYIDMHRPKRGYYVGRLIKMSDDGSKESPFSLTQKYYNLLEKSIRRAPQYWLWSHKRWKRTREDLISHFGKEEAERHLRRP